MGNNEVFSTAQFSPKIMLYNSILNIRFLNTSDISTSTIVMIANESLPNMMATSGRNLALVPIVYAATVSNNPVNSSRNEQN
jgi:hypothetical protein